MIDSTPDSCALLRGAIEELAPNPSSALEEQVVEQFLALRGPLLRYLATFPLSIHDSEDVVQEAFLSLYRLLRSGNSIQEERGWLFRAAHSLALKKRLRARKDFDTAGTALPADHLAADPGLNPEDQLIFNRTQQRMQAVVRALPEQDRWCLYLRAEGLRYRQIAEVLNISLGSVAASLERSLARLGRAVER
jgi:RNA polymerase sigma-70 factor (ECF subfamily)